MSSEIPLISLIRNPKPWTTSPETVLHNRDLTYSFIIERRECRDVLNIFSPDWQLVRQIVLDTEDAAGAAWSPASDLVCVWDSSLYYRVQAGNVQDHETTTYNDQRANWYICMDPFFLA